MLKMEAPAPVATGTGAGQGRCDSTPHHSAAATGSLASHQPVFVLRFAPLPGIDGTCALRQLLKRALRDHGLRCVACHEEAGQ